MRLRLFTATKTIPDVQTTSQEWKLGPESITKHVDLHARARESEYEKLLFDNGQHEPDNDISPEITVRQDLPNNETCTTPGTKQGGSPEIFSHIDEVGDGTDTDHYMEPDEEANLEQPSPTDVSPRSTKYDVHHNHKPNCNGNYKDLTTNLPLYGTRNYIHHMWILEKCYGTLTEHLRTYT